MKAIPPVEVIHTAANTTDGLAHVSLFLAAAFSAAAAGRADAGQVVPLAARADLPKCAGAGLATCASCARSLAPAGPGQCWTEPLMEHGKCIMFASVERYGRLYAAAPACAEGVLRK
ncbi:hypothetical protein AAKU55_003163 [Oxalobacteraceae bacterium GrIS 1.11]